MKFTVLLAAACVSAKPRWVEEWDDDLTNNIPGEPGIDYPIFSSVPLTNFDCKGKTPGYYGDTETACQVFHVCHYKSRQDSFLCPNGSVFDQTTFACEWWFNVDCAASPRYYELNNNLFKGPDVSLYGKISPELLDFMIDSLGIQLPGSATRQTLYDGQRQPSYSLPPPPQVENYGQRQPSYSLPPPPQVEITSFVDVQEEEGDSRNNELSSELDIRNNDGFPSFATEVPEVPSVIESSFPESIETSVQDTGAQSFSAPVAPSFPETIAPTFSEPIAPTFPEQSEPLLPESTPESQDMELQITNLISDAKDIVDSIDVIERPVPPTRRQVPRPPARRPQIQPQRQAIRPPTQTRPINQQPIRNQQPLRSQQPVRTQQPVRSQQPTRSPPRTSRPAVPSRTQNPAVFRNVVVDRPSARPGTVKRQETPIPQVIVLRPKSPQQAIQVANQLQAIQPAQLRQQPTAVQVRQQPVQASKSVRATPLPISRASPLPPSSTAKAPSGVISLKKFAQEREARAQQRSSGGFRPPQSLEGGFKPLIANKRAAVQTYYY